MDIGVALGEEGDQDINIGTSMDIAIAGLHMGLC